VGQLSADGGLVDRQVYPVQIQSVQSSLFHDRKQTNETVDEYAQDVRHLFYLAHLQTQQGTQETEDLAHTVLAYQFVAGLKPNLKSIRLQG